MNIINAEHTNKEFIITKKYIAFRSYNGERIYYKLDCSEIDFCKGIDISIDIEYENYSRYIFTYDVISVCIDQICDKIYLLISNTNNSELVVIDKYESIKIRA